MAPEENSGGGFQTWMDSTARLPERHVIDGLDVLPVVEPSTLDSRKGSSPESRLADSLLHRRKNNARPGLPSFRGLGISSFKPESTKDFHARRKSHSALERIIVHHASQSPATTSSAHISPPQTGSAPLLTPPDEQDSLKWAIQSPTRQSTTVSTHPFAPAGGMSLSGNGEQAENISLEASGNGERESHQELGTNNTAQSTSSIETGESSLWLDRSVGAAGKHILHSLAYVKKY